LGELIIMGELSEREDAWQREATQVAIAEARKMAQSPEAKLHNVPVGRLSDTQWGWLLASPIFGWIKTRCAQAISEGLDQEELVRTIKLEPSAGDVAVIHFILPVLADEVAVDWSKPMASWSKEEMTRFLLTAWQLANGAEVARDEGPGRILKKREGDSRRRDPF
jgi:hypothetical protein